MSSSAGVSSLSAPAVAQAVDALPSHKQQSMLVVVRFLCSSLDEVGNS
jgi:hypothetical protein